MKTFNIPDFYRSRIITPIKEFRRKNDKLKRDYAPTLLDFGPVQFLIARHFGFCYGVENAIDIAYKAIAENPDKRIFLLSEMIHNPDVNRDLVDRGVRFIMDTKGNPLIPWEELNADDIVIVPAFGTTVENQQKLTELGINAYVYDTTCPFVEKVWNRAAQIGEKNYTIIVHGKPNHEETRATFSHSKENAPTVVVENMAQAERLAEYMKGTLPAEQFFQDFKGQYSNGFDPEKDLQRIGVVNQTTMLASDTQGIADFLKNVMIKHYSLRPEQVEDRFANTRDTLCYATNDNQDATYALLTHEADLVIVAGGYNSSNTTHLVELCEQKFPTYFIESVNKILDKQLIRHFNLHSKEEMVTENYLPQHTPARIMLTCGASCPDAVVEGILMRLLSFFEGSKDINEVMQQF
ncbi:MULTISPECIES: 4-hydroxy-3-methylbut-2-enyl diphosphate reductase [Dyadobacter]|uniref:4-hydroxy-3-methylbut-2-enyl diphosphate reductase n=1 Tax=Dyadobacter chenhuakuii TaxID=2909339 RepID=A0A9X1QCW1_9BACT|nr:MULTISPECIES: 4-hydroxy-3-methylbut-2-enyl diphosphate reductase [Dyadobacter]MCE7073500.1 4-hydroxy-3-methylbut-2-enyl diphosphate reductase [Dyadobacter sp. CY327]MCF2495948.1 4-hydroxy-3-methylbut-2-enyl diphosphate reductase [Dyadobacter chenhuakuii]MCF2499395.1 4-hydroxy-3-methylbut-2-enyl diphosphate reductase [Dyadobacter chenhuakuii]USJ30018.1 4-hydroxy-3-methylbut-2-enyl diphosphate reductase [Dyadobacter chenhuakuii]